MKYLFLGILLVCTSAQATRLGNDAGGGGSSVELDFVQIFQLSLVGIQESQKKGLDLFAGFDAKKYQEGMAATQVEGVDSLCINEVEPNTGNSSKHCLDAQFLPDKKKIQFNTNSWSGKTCMQKLAIVMHEFGRASGNEDGNYKYSSRAFMSPELNAFCRDYENYKNAVCGQDLNILAKILNDLSPAKEWVPGSIGYVRGAREQFRAWANSTKRECVDLGKPVCLDICAKQIGIEQCFLYSCVSPFKE